MLSLRTVNTTPVPLMNRVPSYIGRLSGWDLSSVKTYLVEKGLYEALEVDVVEIEYKRFIALALSYGDVPVSEYVDTFWHTHLLFTEDYSQMCDFVAGKFLHHRPKNLDEAAHEKRDTVALYTAHFGEPDATMWNMEKVCSTGNCD